MVLKSSFSCYDCKRDSLLKGLKNMSEVIYFSKVFSRPAVLNIKINLPLIHLIHFWCLQKNRIRIKIKAYYRLVEVFCLLGEALGMQKNTAEGGTLYPLAFPFGLTPRGFHIPDGDWEYVARFCWGNPTCKPYLSTFMLSWQAYICYWFRAREAVYYIKLNLITGSKKDMS